MQNTKQECCSWEGTTEEATAVQKNIPARLKFANVHLDVPQRYWQNILWTDETTLELFGRRKIGTAHQHQNLIPTVKYGGGSIMFCGLIAIIDGKINSQVYHDIL